MRTPLTKDIVNQRLAVGGRGIRLIGDYVNNGTKTTFACDCGNIWDAIPINVLRGSGCPVCAGKAPLTKDIVNARLTTAGRTVRLIGDFTNGNTKTTFACDCGNIWDALPANVLGGSGCPVCSGCAPLTKDIVNQRLATAGRTTVRLIGDFTNTKIKATFACDCGNIWEAKPSSILSGSGCPVCAEYGFNPGKPAEFYYASVDTECGESVFMIGITNKTFEKRYKAADHQYITLLGRIRFTDGAVAAKFERDLKAKYAYLRATGVTTKLAKKGNTTNSTEIFTTNIIGLEKAEGGVIG